MKYWINQISIRTKRFVLPLLITCLAVSQQAMADQLFLKNGDILTGVIVKKETNQLIFKTSYAGELKIRWSEISTLTSEKPLKLVMDNGDNIKAKLDESLADNVLISEPDELTGKLYETSDVKYINASPDITGEGYVWTGSINAGTTFTSGNSETKSARVDAKTSARGLVDRYNLGGFVFWAEDSGTQTAYNTRLDGQYDRFFTKKWYGYVNTTLEKDRFRDIKLRSRLGTGLGYQIFESEPLNLAVEAGINYIDENFYVADRESYAALRWALKYDQKLFHSTTSIFHNHEIIYGMKSASETLIYTQTGLKFPLLFNFNATSQVDYNVDSKPAEGRKKADTRMIFTLGYDW